MVLPFVSGETWIAALGASTCIGMTSLIPWMFNLTFFQKQKGNLEEDNRMNFLISFAAGAILGDVFFHLIPESFHQQPSTNKQEYFSEAGSQREAGLSVLAGIFVFIMAEMVIMKMTCSKRPIEEDEPSEGIKAKQIQSTGNLGISKISANALARKLGMLEQPYDKLVQDLNNNSPSNIDYDTNNNNNSNSNSNNNNNNNNNPLSDLNRSRQSNEVPILKDEQNEVSHIVSNIDTAGYLNLIANGFDNFTHGLAIGASFLVSLKVGLLTSFVIIVHEIPHEICDYAILVNSGFTRWDALKAQASVSLFGVLGTVMALYMQSTQALQSKTAWILPFSAGGFLYIALVNLLPEILEQKTKFITSLGQIACILLGMALMSVIDFI